MEEAMHPLCWAVFGNYGKESVANGAPFRINIPWKYGFKSPKFVVGIRTTDEKPPATWNRISHRVNMDGTPTYTPILIPSKMVTIHPQTYNICWY